MFEMVTICYCKKYMMNKSPPQKNRAGTPPRSLTSNANRPESRRLCKKILQLTVRQPVFCSLLTVGSSESWQKGFCPWTSTGHHGWPFSQKRRLRKLFQLYRACQIQGWSCSLKKAPAANWLAAAGLVESWVGTFTEEKRLRPAG